MYRAFYTNHYQNNFVTGLFAIRKKLKAIFEIQAII